VPKKGHVCPYQPKLKRRADEPPPVLRNAAVQVEMDEFMTLRRLNLRIQGLPESYATEPYMGDNMVVGEPHPVPGPSLPLPPEHPGHVPPPHRGTDLSVPVPDSALMTGQPTSAPPDPHELSNLHPAPPLTTSSPLPISKAPSDEAGPIGSGDEQSRGDVEVRKTSSLTATPVTTKCDVAVGDGDVGDDTGVTTPDHGSADEKKMECS